MYARLSTHAYTCTYTQKYRPPPFGRWMFVPACQRSCKPNAELSLLGLCWGAADVRGVASKNDWFLNHVGKSIASFRADNGRFFDCPETCPAFGYLSKNPSNFWRLALPKALEKRKNRFFLLIFSLGFTSCTKLQSGNLPTVSFTLL